MAAQAGANLITGSTARPSIFELVASQSLDLTFYPALKKIALVTLIFCLQNFGKFQYFDLLQYLGNKRPEKYANLVKYYDEIFLVANALVQNYYLRKNCKY